MYQTYRHTQDETKDYLEEFSQNDMVSFLPSLSFRFLHFCVFPSLWWYKSICQHIRGFLCGRYSSTEESIPDFAVVLSVPVVLSTNEASCFVVNYAGFPKCWLNWDSIYSCRMAETWCGSELGWRVLMAGTAARRTKCWYRRKWEERQMC